MRIKKSKIIESKEYIVKPDSLDDVKDEFEDGDRVTIVDEEDESKEVETIEEKVNPVIKKGDLIKLIKENYEKKA
tara:strand:- start:141 stop:365 length:225 start_codon:yes stop_codon:yes gene_type:complete